MLMLQNLAAVRMVFDQGSNTRVCAWITYVKQWINIDLYVLSMENWSGDFVAGSQQAVVQGWES